MKNNLNQLWAYLIIEELISQGINTFTLSPGSRSTPLIAAVAQHPKAKSFMHYDERGAAFFALGYGRATQKPAVLICTSGSALANYFPALVEASEEHVPMLLLTADRPPELLQAGANQAIRQKGIFGDYVRNEFELPCPTKKIKPEFVLTTIDQALYITMRKPEGPVHINCMFREPLIPSIDLKEAGEYLKTIDTRRHPYTTYSPLKISCTEVESIAKTLESYVGQRNVIIAGELRSKEDQNSVLALAEKLQWPLFPDITSGLRLGNKSEVTIPYFDQMLQTMECLINDSFDNVLHIGGRYTSKRLMMYLQARPLKNYIVVKDHPMRHDPTHLISKRVEADIAAFCLSLCSEISQGEKTLFLEELQWGTAQVEALMEEEISEYLGDLAIVRTVISKIPEGHGLFLGNSLSIRNVDMYASAAGAKVRVAANRGASGIDGNIASACGFAAGLCQPITALLGDLACLHDLNSLAYLKKLDVPVTVIVVNNKGGGIFHYLSIADHEQIFQEFFETPHEFSFRAAAELFGLNYAQPLDNRDLSHRYGEFIEKGYSGIFELKTDSVDNVIKNRSIKNECIKKFHKLTLGG